MRDLKTGGIIVPWHYGKRKMARRDSFDRANLVAIATYAIVLFNNRKTQWLDIMSGLSIEDRSRFVEVCKIADKSRLKSQMSTHFSQ